MLEHLKSNLDALDSVLDALRPLQAQTTGSDEELGMCIDVLQRVRDAAASDTVDIHGGGLPTPDELRTRAEVMANRAELHRTAAQMDEAVSEALGRVADLLSSAKSDG